MIGVKVGEQHIIDIPGCTPAFELTCNACRALAAGIKTGTG
jgi:hypothetical protein